MKRLLHIFLCCLPALVLLACNKDKGALRPVISVSVAPQKAILEQIVDSLYDINVLIPDNADPETFDPSMQTLADIANSRAFFSVGAESFEQNTVQKIKANFPDIPVIDTSAGIEFIRDTHGSGAPDPHIWASVRNARVIAASMADEMCRLDPQNAERFRSNARILTARLDSLDNAFSQKFEKHRAAFAVWHPAFSYFARDYNLTQLPLEIEGKEASPGQFKQRLDAIAAAKATVMIADPKEGLDKATAAAKQLNIPVVPINLLSSDWFNQIARLADSL